MAFVRGGNVNRVSLLAEGEAEIIEFQATGSLDLLERPLSGLDLPRGVLIGALIRDRKAIIPKGSDEIRDGDSVVLFTLQSRMPFVESLLRRNKAGELSQPVAAGEPDGQPVAEG
jgi:trk system potassium uptake protein TrkA